MKHIINHKTINNRAHICVRNPSAWWIPEPILNREIGGTEYTVTGSFEGGNSLLRKIERITAAKFTETEVDRNE